MDDDPLTEGELSSELTGLNKGEKAKKKKQLIFGIALASFLIITFIIIIIIIVSSSDSGSNEQKKEEDKKEEEEVPTLPVIGEITCTYYIQSNNKNTLILGNDFNKDSDFSIYIDGKIIKYSKEYQFSSTGNHIIQFKLYNKINMDNMFKDITDLISVEMKSEENCEITSMLSTIVKI